MYRYDHYDHALVTERVEEFRDQVARYLAGALSEEEFLPLRLQRRSRAAVPPSRHPLNHEHPQPTGDLR